MLERVCTHGDDARRAALELHHANGEPYIIEHDPWKATYPFRVHRWTGAEPMPRRGDVRSFHAVTGRAVTIAFVVGSPRVVRLPRIERVPVPARVVHEVLAA